MLWLWAHHVFSFSVVRRFSVALAPFGDSATLSSRFLAKRPPSTEVDVQVFDGLFEKSLKRFFCPPTERLPRQSSPYSSCFGGRLSDMASSSI